MPKIYDVMSPIGKYTNNDGQEKTRWLKCGMIVKTAAGKVALKLDALPVAPMGGEEGGLWLQLFTPNQPEGAMHTANAPAGNTGFREAAPAPAATQGAPVPAAAPQYPAQGGSAFDDDDIPF